MKESDNVGHQYKVGGYVKLAKLWERTKDQAIKYNRDYYITKFQNNEIFQLYDVYIDITGEKRIPRRWEMVRLLRDVSLGRINCIAVQTRAYLAANTDEFCCLLKYLFEMKERIDIITEDKQYNINTIRNEDQQREALLKMANDMIALKPKSYTIWCADLLKSMNDLDDHKENTDNE